jgi:putative IMPACT (imprinted ancient) family translation regulator
MQKLSLNLEQNYILSYKRKILPNVIVDRKSKYTVVWWYITKKEDIKKFLWDLLVDKYFKKATHNSYAYRILLENWSILEWKNDDWETGAWNCILRELQRENMVNIIVVVTRYFGWIHLNADRFKNVINATKEILKFKKEK